MPLEPEKLIRAASDAPDAASLDRVWKRVNAAAPAPAMTRHDFTKPRENEPSKSKALAAAVFLILTVGLFALTYRPSRLPSNDGKNPSTVADEGSAPEKAVLDAAEIEKLVAQLGADTFETRNEAQAALRKLGAKARNVLEQHASSEDVEVRSRVAVLLRELVVDEARALDKAWVLAGWRPALGASLAAPPATRVDDNLGVSIDDSVDAALAWLAASQEADGHWDSVKHGAQVNADLDHTAFALLAFLGAGHTEKVGAHKPTVARAVAWLKSRQAASGAFLNSGKSVPEGYSHALAGMAMSEAAGMANVADTKRSAQNAVDYSTDIHQSMNEEKTSGFGRTARSEFPDMLTTTLYALHLKSAKVAGLSVPHESFEGIIRFLASMEDTGRNMFSPAPEQKPAANATLMACLARQFLGSKTEDLAQFMEVATRDFRPDGEDALVTYFGTLAVFQQGGDLWKNWNDQMRKNLPASQRTTGIERGSWNPSGKWAGAGRVVTTAMNALCLEIYYRYRQLSP